MNLVPSAIFSPYGKLLVPDIGMDIEVCRGHLLDLHRFDSIGLHLVDALYNIFDLNFVLLHTISSAKLTKGLTKPLPKAMRNPDPSYLEAH
jgi:hypothetical protein